MHGWSWSAEYVLRIFKVLSFARGILKYPHHMSLTFLMDYKFVVISEIVPQERNFIYNMIMNDFSKGAYH